jgi:hypothetical protein
MKCELCGRFILPEDRSKHHLIPKSLGGGNGPTVTLHEVCHKQIHALFDEKTLCNHLNTMKAIKANYNIQRFIKWIQNKPIDFKVKAKWSNNRRQRSMN